MNVTEDSKFGVEVEVLEQSKTSSACEAEDEIRWGTESKHNSEENGDDIRCVKNKSNRTIVNDNDGENKTRKGSIEVMDKSEVEEEYEDEIRISQVSKHNSGGRYRNNKQHCCKFCRTMFVAISRHIVYYY